MCVLQFSIRESVLIYIKAGTSVILRVAGIPNDVRVFHLTNLFPQLCSEKLWDPKMGSVEYSHILSLNGYYME